MIEVIIVIVGLYMLGAVICLGIILEYNNFNPCISILWPIILLILIIKCIITAFKEIPKIWKI